MEHPLVPNLDNLTVEDLGKTINDLHKKLAIATRTGNGYLCDQIRMVLESYQNKYTEKSQAMFKKDGGDKFIDKIDIS